MAEATTVARDQLGAALRDLPRPAQLAFAYAAQLRRGTLEVSLPDGRHLKFGGLEPGPAAIMVVKDLGFAWKLIRGGDIGIAEAYLHGQWESPDLTQFLQLFCVNHDMIQSMLGGKPLMRLWQMLRHWLNRNTKGQAQRNIQAHYDLGNGFYAAWLDRTMTYSSALFDRGANDLSSAQLRKYQSLAERIEVKPGQRLLEIGCGWGGFAEFVAKAYDVSVVALTISRQQFDYAKARMFAAGLNDKVDIRLQDYRDERGTYDRIASIEMIEAVGERFWPTYFQQIRDRLSASGLAGIQAITIQDKFFGSYRREVDFIQRYIFPGGMLPTPSILQRLGENFGIPLVSERIFGEDYAKTLAAWRERFRAAWPSLVPLGFDERFRRLWEYYLAYCEAGFLSGNIDVRQMVFAKSG
jgi:cyclopropane-fatty-acyl-phospholipid synthase